MNDQIENKKLKVQNDANKKYLPAEIEKKWQRKWEEVGLYKFSESDKKEKYYTLVEWPYPSGDLHIGHWFSFATADVHARAHKMMGQNVFFTNGFDAFGLPAENAAIKRGVHPQDWTVKNMETMRKQFDTMGSMIDWDHTTAACFPEYYKWNQWIFIQMYKKGLAYRGKMLTNWCPTDQTVLANENIENGKCWRCGSEVIQKEVEQWFIKLTAYADKLIWPNPTEEVSSKSQESRKNASTPSGRSANNSSLSEAQRVEGFTHKSEAATVDWPVSVKVAQNQWIGRSEGVHLEFKIENSEYRIKVFTTALDTVYGVEFLVLAPEHPLVKEILKQVQDDKLQKQVNSYIEVANKKTELDRMAETKEKTGVFTGAYAINPFNNKKIQIWIADYVIMTYGTGVVMGVPGHDARDYEFAKKFGLPITPVVKPKDNVEGAKVESDGFWNYLDIKSTFKESSELFNSGEFTGLTSNQAKKKMETFIEEKGFGEKFTNYHIHDWSISRQRYWGTPVPMVHCEKCGIVPVPEDQLPVELPYNVDFTPKGEPPLASNKEWLQTTCPTCKGPATRDPETLDTFFDSSWYFFRYLDPHYNSGPFPQDMAKRMLPVDIYFGGAEHTLGHTLYARFFTKFFKELGLIDFEEFAKRRVQHGVILGLDGNRMSKSKGNVVNPDDVVKEYGADAVRVYLCFMMPYDATAPWAPGGMWGTYRFLKRVWDLQFRIKNLELRIKDEKSKGVTRAEGIPTAQTEIGSTGGRDNERQDPETLSQKDLFEMHTAIKKIREDAGSTKFNTGVSTLMKWINYLSAKETVATEEYKTFLLLLAPFAPHITEEIWQSRKFSATENNEFVSIHQQVWPTYEEQYLLEETVTIVVQVNGKVRDNIRIKNQESRIKENVIKLAKESEKVKKHLEGATIQKEIYIQGKILNFVVG